ncbi:hypothetical protein PRUPE_4G190600 [Prunus persica]|uniref:Uncharacterized protein n=1 Tax=Prunus persica TaxID=3760 RepID=A0A251PMU4_PRUPE|nr:hypothetical protein PRUPE_4G190600 [Prunus persica]
MTKIESTVVAIYMRYLYDLLKKSNMEDYILNNMSASTQDHNQSLNKQRLQGTNLLNQRLQATWIDP